MSHTIPITIYQGDTWHQLRGDERERVQQWLIDHSIDPCELPLGENIVIRGTDVCYWGMFIESREGNRLRVRSQADENGQLCVVAEERSVPWNGSLPND